MKNISITNCTRCTLCKNQKPLLDNERKVDVMWVGISAKRIKNIETETPLQADTNTGRLVADIEAECPDLQFYKTNLVKCLPLDEGGKLRHPSSFECSLCYPNLLEEIQRVRPQVIFLLGGKVTKFIMGKIGIKVLKLSYDYEAFQHNNKWYVPIHHPSYISIYRRKEKDVYIQSVRVVLKRLIT